MITVSTMSRRHLAALGGVLVCMTLFYFFTASTGRFPAVPQRDLGYYYDYLSRAFMAGRTSLLIEPDPRLLQLADPYDPVQNERLRLHDAVFFDGKYYLYYGPTPAVVLFVPFRAVTGLDLTEPWAVAIFCTTGLFFSFRLLQFLSRTYLPDTPWWLLMAAILAVGFGNMTPFLLRRPLHYEVAIASGYAFAMAGIYYFVVGMLGPRVRRGWLLLGSLLVGLAGGARFPSFAAGFVAIVLVAYTIVTTWRTRPLREHLLTLAACAVPAGICLFALGYYNYVRFDSWTEFGMRYTLQGYQSARTYVFYSWARVPAGLCYYLVVPPRLIPTFPFLVPDPGYFKQPPHDYYLEPVSGLLPNVPLLAILGFAPLFWPTFRRRLPMSLVAAAMGAVGTVLLILVCLAAGTMRYEVDFASYFVVPALLLWAVAVNVWPPGDWRRRLVVTAFALTLAATIIVGSALSVTGYYDDLRLGRPDLFALFADMFAPLERLLGGGR